MTDKQPAKVKATKKLTEISFEHEGAAIALVSASQGGPANGKSKTLQLKATSGFSKETIQKAQQIQVTLDIPEFLQKFFGLYYTDSQVLAQLMGYVPPVEDESMAWDSTSYIDEQVASFTILKSMQKGNHVTQLASLSETDYLQFLEDQAMLEGVMKQVDAIKAPTKQVAKKSKSKGEPMTQEVEDNKSELVQVQKALDEQKVELQKALDLITKFKEAEVQAVVKAKTDKVNAVIKNVDHQGIIAKACLELESEEDFGAFIAAMTAMQAQVGASEMFLEKGLQSSVDKPAETPADKVMAVVKARIAAGK
jgi:hypothetical protein